MHRVRRAWSSNCCSSQAPTAARTSLAHPQPAFYDAGAVKRAAHTLFRPVKAAAWALFGAIFKLQTSVPCECD